MTWPDLEVLELRWLGERDVHVTERRAVRPGDEVASARLREPCQTEDSAHHVDLLWTQRPDVPGRLTVEVTYDVHLPQRLDQSIDARALRRSSRFETTATYLCTRSRAARIVGPDT